MKKHETKVNVKDAASKLIEQTKKILLLLKNG